MTEILSDFLVKNDKGYYCKYGDFYLDPLQPVEIAVVSHAHADHATPGHGNTIATAATLAFMQLRYQRKMKGNCIEKDFHELFTIGDVDIEFIPAGHILGSAQILMIFRGVKYLYTGDYKMTADVTCESIESVEADVLITETTFADPEVRHPDPATEIQKIRNRGANIMLGCYALGKAQSITALINAHCPELEVYIHRNMIGFHRIYDQSGLVKLDYKIYGRREFKQGSPNKVYLVPPMTFNNYYRATGVLRVFASGWHRLQQSNDISLYISDHVDWSEIIEYIEQVKPKQIWTVHGEGGILRNYFEDKLEVRELYKV